MADDASPDTLPPTAQRGREEVPLRPYRFSRAQFQAMIAAGVIAEGARVELIGGEIYAMPSEGYAHADGVARLLEALAPHIPQGFLGLMGTRLDVDSASEVYPDLMVVRVGLSARDRSPQSVLLLVEVAQATLQHDSGVKGPRYAAAGYQEYWIFEPAARRVWVHRDPKPDGQWGLIVMREGEEALAPLFAPEAQIAIPLIADRADLS